MNGCHSGRFLGIDLRPSFPSCGSGWPRDSASPPPRVLPALSHRAVSRPEIHLPPRPRQHHAAPRPHHRASIPSRATRPLRIPMQRDPGHGIRLKRVSHLRPSRHHESHLCCPTQRQHPLCACPETAPPPPRPLHAPPFLDIPSPPAPRPPILLQDRSMTAALPENFPPPPPPSYNDIKSNFLRHIFLTNY